MAAAQKIRAADEQSRAATSRAEKVEAAILKIEAFHELGRNLPAGQDRKEDYGRGIIDDEAGRLHINPDTVRKARVFADPDDGYRREELAELVRLIREEQMEQDERLAIFGQTHIIRLLSVHPRQRRAALQRECIRKGWSTSKLEAEIAKRFGTRRQGGRTRRVPANDSAALLTQLEALCERWRRWHRSLKEEAVTVPARLGAEVESVSAQVLSLQKKVVKALGKLQPGRESRNLEEEDDD